MCNISFFVKSYGCQMNVYDSQKIESVLKKHKFKLVSNIIDADIVVFNTCYIRDKASCKLFFKIKLSILAIIIKSSVTCAFFPAEIF